MYRCLLCISPTLDDDAVAPTASGSCICLRCFTRHAGDPLPMPQALRGAIETVVEEALASPLIVDAPRRRVETAMPSTWTWNGALAAFPLSAASAPSSIPSPSQPAEDAGAASGNHQPGVLGGLLHRSWFGWIKKPFRRDRR